jgi:hypothetical protein
VEGCCEHCKEPSGSIKCWGILEWLHNWQLLRKGSAPWVTKKFKLYSIAFCNSIYDAVESQTSFWDNETYWKVTPRRGLDKTVSGTSIWPCFPGRIVSVHSRDRLCLESHFASKSRALVYQAQKTGRDYSVTNSFSFHYISHLLSCFVFAMNVPHLTPARANESLHNKRMTDSIDCV